VYINTNFLSQVGVHWVSNMLRRNYNDTDQQSAESAVRKEQSLWQKGFAEQVGFKPEVKDLGSWGR